MKNENRSQAFLRKRKMLLVMPLLVIPFLTMAFWALGGGSAAPDAKPVASKGLNLDLPSSKMEDNRDENKLSFYDKAKRDSEKVEEWMRNDPYYTGRQDTAKRSGELEQITTQAASKFNQHLNTTPYETTETNPEQKLMQKITALQGELAKSAGQDEKLKKQEPDAAQNESDVTEQMNRLQTMMEGMQTADSADPEMKQIGTTLDKILDIQHPERVKERLTKKAITETAPRYMVEKTSGAQTVSLLGYEDRKSATQFYSINNFNGDRADGNAFEAEVFSNQTLVNSSVVRFRLLHDVYINDRPVPAGTFVNGVASLNNERLEVDIAGIKTGTTILPVKLLVYDLDGLPGLYVPGTISRDVAKKSVDNGLQLLELSTMDPSLKAQLAATGINSAKNLLSRKAKQVKVFVKAGYNVLLKNASQPQ